MKVGEIIKIDSRQNSGMVDDWTEYLCLEKFLDGFELTIRSSYGILNSGKYDFFPACFVFCRNLKKKRIVI